jgi:ribonucleoside-diphosphate reductase alpha chain
MASRQNFQTDGKKYTTKESQTDIYNPEFNQSVQVRGNNEMDSFTKNLPKWIDFISWARFYPDLFLDLITPETGGIRLDLDQRVFLRCAVRFVSVYGVFPRGYGKTFVEILAMYLVAIFFPDIELTMTAQTRENASKLMEEKHREIVKFYPLIANEITKYSFSKDTAEVIFVSGSRCDIMANHQSSKGARRKRINIEESALLNNDLFQDVLEPIVNVPRRTIGKQAVVNPEELNGQVNFFTTSGFKGSDEFARNIKMIDEMAELKGKIVIGADWQLACAYGRGETKSQILDKKAKLSPVFFAMNYGSKWVGSVDNQLVDINRLMNTRILVKSELKGDGKSEYVLGVDVARSEDTSNNQTSIAVVKIKRVKGGRISTMSLVNIINVSNALNFSAQAVEVKRTKHLYNAKAVIIDSNGIGKGLLDKLLEDTIDPITGDSLGCWGTFNTEQEPEMEEFETCVYDLKPQSANSDIIVKFIDAVESNQLHVLEKRHFTDYDITDKDVSLQRLPFVNTDFFIEEVANLKLKQLPSGKYTVEKVIKKYNKDRYSATSYAIWYIKMFEDVAYQEEDDDSIFGYLIV